MRTEIRKKSAEEYRQKFEEMKRMATVADVHGDEAGKRSYEKLAEGWSAMIKHAEQRRQP